MKTIIAGSRTLVNMEAMCLNKIRELVSDNNIIITRGISGAARGPDKFGEKYFKEIGVPFDQFFPNWDLYGKSAGYRRNEEMAKNGEQLICLWDGVSKGTKSMIELAREYGLKVWIITLDIEPQNPPAIFMPLPAAQVADPRQIPLF